MSNPNMRPTQKKASGFNPNDIPFILARHKWKIVLCTIVSIVAAGVYHSSILPDYISETKIFIKYVENTVDPTSDRADIQNVAGRGNGHVINSEIEMLTSMDLITEVAQNVSPAKINQVGKSKLDTLIGELFSKEAEADSAGDDENIFKAIHLVQSGLSVELINNSSILLISFQHPNPLLSQPILEEIVNTYFKRHLTIHNQEKDWNGFLTREADKFRGSTQRTDKQIQKLYRQINFNSIEEAKSWEANETTRLRQEILRAQALLAETEATIGAIAPTTAETETNLPAETTDFNEIETLNEEILAEHANIAQRLQVLRNREQELLLQYTTKSTFVRNIREQISLAEREMLDLVRANPALTKVDVAQVGGNLNNNALNLIAAKRDVLALTTRINTLEAQLAAVKEEGRKVNEIQLDIEELEMKKDLYVANYKNYVENIEKFRVQEILDDSEIRNMETIQKPTPPYSDQSKTNQVVAGIAAAGLIIGIGWAFLIELYLDRTFKRSVEVERGLGIPLFASIPNAYSRSYLRLSKSVGKESLRLTAANKAAALHSGNKASESSSSLISTASAVSEKQVEAESDPAPWNENHALHPYFEALRDRMLGFFDSKNLTHSPKMIGLTGLGEATGVSTIAGGLAGALSNMGEGNVLLVDMNLGQESAHQFYQGKTVTPQEDSQDENSSTQIEKNLFVVAEGTNGYKLPRIDPKRFNDLVTKLKNSEYDYIVFDLPAVSPISATPRLARAMDTVMLVIESEKSDKNVVEKATSILRESNENVGAILNKTKIYAPGQLKQDFVGHS
ncbi:Wzz/FepE/Etk N-terminal domain-containing protein [Puniceicoccaceae bacterium K14]|nr:Wzz/FepE/Etk N-terminal domain-containing protein [Puniceicoccaceae bacterium K14]